MTWFYPLSAFPTDVASLFQNFPQAPGFLLQQNIWVMVVQLPSHQQWTRITRNHPSLACPLASDLNLTRALVKGTHPLLRPSLHHKTPITLHLKVPRKRIPGPSVLRLFSLTIP